MMVDYLPIMLVPDKFPVELAHWLAARFEMLNGKRVRIVEASELPPQAQAVHMQCALAWIWDIAPRDVQRVMVVSTDIVPLRALPELADVAFIAAEGGNHHTKRMMETYPLIHDTQRFFNSRFFIARRDTVEVFERLKAFASSKTANDPRNGDYLQTVFNLLVQSTTKVTWLSHDCNVSVATDPFEHVKNAVAINLCALDALPKLVVINMLRTVLGLRVYADHD